MLRGRSGSINYLEKGSGGGRRRVVLSCAMWCNSAWIQMSDREREEVRITVDLSSSYPLTDPVQSNYSVGICSVSSS